MFIHFKGKHNILVDAISSLKMLNIYEEPLETQTQVVINRQQFVTEVCATNMHTLSVGTLCNEQEWYKMCRTLVSYSNKNSFNSVTVSARGILQKHQYIHWLQHDVAIAPCSLLPMILHKFHDSKGHQEIRQS